MKLANTLVSSFCSSMTIFVMLTVLLLASRANAASKQEAAADFRKITAEIISQLRPHSPLKLQNVTLDVELLDAKLKSAEIQFTSRTLVLPDGTRVDAINYPEANLIEIRQNVWLEAPLVRRQRLAIHELLGIAGVADPEYRTSAEVLSYLSRSAHETVPVADFSGVWETSELSVEVTDLNNETKIHNCNKLADRPLVSTKIKQTSIRFAIQDIRINCEVGQDISFDLLWVSRSANPFILTINGNSLEVFGLRIGAITENEAILDFPDSLESWRIDKNLIHFQFVKNDSDGSTKKISVRLERKK